MYVLTFSSPAVLFLTAYKYLACLHTSSYAIAVPIYDCRSIDTIYYSIQHRRTTPLEKRLFVLSSTIYIRYADRQYLIIILFKNIISFAFDLDTRRVELSVLQFLATNGCNTLENSKRDCQLTMA